MTGSAAACDCKRARHGKVETAICGDPAARAADARCRRRRAVEALRRANNEGAGEDRAGATGSTTRRRLRGRKDDGKLARVPCRQKPRRGAFLSGAAQAGPGARQAASRLFRIEDGRQRARPTSTSRFSDFLARPTRPNAPSTRRSIRLSGNIEDPDKDDWPRAANYAYAWTMRLAYASPRLISAHAEGYADDRRGLSQLTFSANINIDVRAGREATFESLLDKPGGAEGFSRSARIRWRRKRSAARATTALDADARRESGENVETVTGDLKSGASAPTPRRSPTVLARWGLMPRARSTAAPLRDAAPARQPRLSSAVIAIAPPPVRSGTRLRPAFPAPCGS